MITSYLEIMQKNNHFFIYINSTVVKDLLIKMTVKRTMSYLTYH